MRIQHNIMAMNAYRNYGNNTSALSKNLEKLSSGYRINRAGDDAAGLAISEKMRAQIQGLNAAQKNVKDGISLVKTAEGAMQEIQDMLSRMKYLATQSANGTYEDAVDREALQDEVNQLLEEIDRIAESANFNGKKLLDGSLDDGSFNAPSAPASVIGDAQKTAIDAIKTALEAGTGWTSGSTTKDSVQEIDLSGLSFENAGKVTVKMAGNEYEVEVTAGMNGTAFAKALAAAYNAGTKVADGVNDGSEYAVMAANGKLTFTDNKHSKKVDTSPFADFDIVDPNAKTSGSKAPTFDKGDATKDLKTDFGINDADWSGVKGLTDETGNGLEVKAEVGADGTVKITIGDKVYEGKAKNTKGATTEDIELKVAGDTDGEFGSIKITVDNQKVATNGAAITADTVGTLTIPSDGTGLQLQIGDTSDTYNQMTVVVGDMHHAIMGLGNLSIENESNAATAINKVKDAINYVSAVRGRLGAVQNRLEHTANNLSVMTENITDAESTIRDTDVADEMMAYTKNNILIQSAQAMLAQANAVPQGVLQLLG